MGDFNVATSSLHALSNTLSRTEKHSPHSSPRQSRKSWTTVATTTASGSSTSLSFGNCPIASSSMSAQDTNSCVADPSSPVSSRSANDLISINSGNSRMAGLDEHRPGPQQCKSAISFPSMQSPMSLPKVAGSIVAKSGNQQRVQSSESASTSFDSGITSPILSENGDIAPPLPPRKLPAVAKKPPPDQQPPILNRAATKSVAEGGIEVGPGNLKVFGPVVEAFEVPLTHAPPVPKHSQSNLTSSGPRDEKWSEASEISDEVIVGPAETITGLIDTRPMESRKPLGRLQESMQSQPEGLLVEKELVGASNCNNLYQLKTASGVPGIAPITRNTLVTSPTSSKSERGIDETSAENTGDRTAIGCQPLLYENLSINQKDFNVPYENINLEYIARLVNEGYSKENAITALGISRNNIEMACDILHEFVSKTSI